MDSEPMKVRCDSELLGVHRTGGGSVVSSDPPQNIAAVSAPTASPQQQGQAGAPPPTSLPDLSRLVQVLAPLLAEELARVLGHEGAEACLPTPAAELAELDDGQEPEPGLVYDRVTSFHLPDLSAAVRSPRETIRAYAGEAISRLSGRIRDFGPRRFHLLPSVLLEPCALGFVRGLCLRVYAVWARERIGDGIIMMDVAISASRELHDPI